MKYHLVLGRKIDQDGIERDPQLGKCPRHVLLALRDRLNATVHAPEGEAISLSDKLRSKTHVRRVRRTAHYKSRPDRAQCTPY